MTAAAHPDTSRRPSGAGSTSAPSSGPAAPPALRALFPRMALVREYREQLLRLQGAWDLLALLGPMSGIGREIGQTRDDFHRLTDTLVASLARQLLQQRLQGLRSRAQVTIDILVRNLFERTADVGFLATDGPLRDFVRAARDGSAGESERQALQARLRAYCRKYSVYDDIVLLAADGRVLARLDGSAAAGCRPDAGIAAAALRPGTPYVERFGPSELLGGRTGLLYAAAIADDRGQAAGVLCLSFRLEDEMRGVFGHLLGQEGDDSDTVLALLDGDGSVIAGSDPWQLPVGARLTAATDRHGRWLLRFAGREYLAVAARSGGYQGYAGPGWQAVAMVPVELAFRLDDDAADADADADAREQVDGDDLATLARVIDTTDIFDAELRAIPGQAQRIQRELVRSVWNGRLARTGDGASAASSSDFARTFLEEVSRTGRQIEQVFDQAIARLHTGAIAEILDQARFQARLAVDIMDRNLYERANDCRWWALTPALRQALAAPSAAAFDQAGRVLQQINGLYTVYTLLVLFDAGGRIVAVSDPARRDQLVGQAIDARLAQATLALHDPEQYQAAAHLPSALYADRPTCVYSAALTQPGWGGTIVAAAAGAAATTGAAAATATGAGGRSIGGIAIVFDGAPQFQAMLIDALPRAADGRPLDGAIGLFISRSGTVVASTDPRFVAGAAAPLAAASVDLRRGTASRRVVVIDGIHYAAGICQGGGYREYRQGSAEAADDVAAVLLLPLGRSLAQQRAAAPAAFEPRGRRPASARTAAPAASATSATSATSAETAPNRAGDAGDPAAALLRSRRQIAGFSLDGQWFGFDAGEIEEVLGAVPVTGLPQASPHLAGLLRHRGRVVPVLDPGLLLATGPALADGPILICRSGTAAPIAVRVDALGRIFDIDAGDLAPWQPAGRRSRPVELLAGESDGAPAMLTVLSVAALAQGVLLTHLRDAGSGVPIQVGLAGVDPDRVVAESLA